MVFNLAHNENKLYKTLDYWLRDKFNFDFLEQGLGIVSPPMVFPRLRGNQQNNIFLRASERLLVLNSAFHSAGISKQKCSRYIFFAFRLTFNLLYINI